MKNSAVGYEWQDVRKNIFTPEEISASDLRVALIGDLKNTCTFRQDISHCTVRKIIRGNTDGY